MKNKQYILFDFDGTLFDSHKGIIAGVEYALNHFKINEKDDAVLKSFIGPSLKYSFQKHYNFSDEDCKTAILKLRDYYGDKGWKESDVYEGILDLLQALKNKDKKLAIATAKPTYYAEQILKSNDMSHFFDSVRGSSMTEDLYPKERTIREALQDMNVFDKKDAVMIGDTIYDIKGAHENQVESIAVNYGFGLAKDLKDARPTRFVETVAELSSLLI
ncbi:MAG: HAD hydrolase-like protein [Chitinophagales bacterium]